MKYLLSAIALSLFVSGELVAQEDDFLSAVEAESGKVETRHEKIRSTATTDVDGVVIDANEAELDSETSAKSVREVFETTLQEKHHGSYVFYKKLPERSQEEIVQEYLRGSSFVKLRKKIIDRFMQR